MSTDIVWPQKTREFQDHHYGEPRASIRGVMSLKGEKLVSCYQSSHFYCVLVETAEDFSKNLI